MRTMRICTSTCVHGFNKKRREHCPKHSESTAEEINNSRKEHLVTIEANYRSKPACDQLTSKTETIEIQVAIYTHRLGISEKKLRRSKT